MIGLITLSLPYEKHKIIVKSLTVSYIFPQESAQPTCFETPQLSALVSRSPHLTLRIFSILPDWCGQLCHFGAVLSLFRF